ncbi:MAG: SoxR reducing system RseC family protein [Gammaproteobacteria bacterium]|nr:SoxR reducing system RseC family protein [Gammaproteobacteria bacterium]MDH3373854.1 SoxR reducing system RseC family protein [Gammaproteobacteria bacterium]MDH3408396.1 SoxR reducing system RseC family protein [Gammaproteobacteria bacterium]MDH3551567.1 SoxR reducing system RseC family protein [Gammaproteobacteria bacterium]
MDNPTGRVLSLVDGADGTRAIIDIEVADACPRCAAGKGCGAGLMTGSGRNRQVEASIRAGLNVAENDLVEIVLAPDDVLRAAAIVYGLPMLGAVAAAAIAYALSLGDAAAAVAALAGLTVGFTIGRWRLRQTPCLRRFLPSVQRRLDTGSGSAI